MVSEVVVTFNSLGLLGEAGNAGRSGMGRNVISGLVGERTRREAVHDACPAEVLTWQVYSPLSFSTRPGTHRDRLNESRATWQLQLAGGGQLQLFLTGFLELAIGTS